MKKLFSAFLVFALLLLLGCSGGEEKKTPTDGENAATTDASEITAKKFVPNLPDVTFDGYEFRALVPVNNMYSSFTFSVEEETGDILNDTIYKRNKYIEEKYKVVFKQMEIYGNDFWQMGDMFRNSVMSGTDDFDVSTQIDGYVLATQGYTLSADNLPYIDITQPWYPHDINEAISIENKHLITISDECISVYDVVVAFCFNKKLINDLKLENPYELVKNNAWTYNTFFDMCRAASFDIDGDGKMTDVDQYGILSQYDELLAPFWVCAGVRTVVKDKNDMLALNLAGNDKLFDILDKMKQNIYGGKKIFFDTHPASGDKLTSFRADDSIAGGFIDISRQQFEKNLGLFLTARLVRIPTLRAMDEDFGIVPFPKLDESQSRYYAMSGGAWPRVVPNHASNPKRTSIIMEALAAESKNIVIPAYKEVCLKTKFSRDGESAEMLDIIFDNVVEDLGATLFWPTIRNTLIDEVRGKGNFVSVVEKQSAKLEKVLNDINESAANLD